MQALVELGAGVAIVQAVSHNWAGVSDHDPDISHAPVSTRAALAGDLRFMGRLYFRLALALTVLLMATGTAFFGIRGVDPSVSWFWPWCLLSLASGATLFLQGVTYYLEGCDQVDFAYVMYFWQQVVGTAVLWAVLFAGGGLWSLAAQHLTVNVMGGAWIAFHYRRFFRHLLAIPHPPRPAIWPFQKRVALTWVADTVIQMVPNPLAFQFLGAAEAGRLGMSLAIAKTVTASGYQVMSPRLPTLGKLAARGDDGGKRRMFESILRNGMMINVLGAAAVLAGLWVLDRLVTGFSERLLGPVYILVLLTAGTVRAMNQFLAAYFRAHKQEPAALRMLAVAVCAAFVMAAGTWAWGLVGLVGAFIASAVLVELPIMAGVYRGRLTT